MRYIRRAYRMAGRYEGLNAVVFTLSVFWWGAAMLQMGIITAKQNLDIDALLKDQTFLDLIGRNEYQGVRWFRGEAFQECMYLAVFSKALAGKGKLSSDDEMTFRQEIDKWLRRCAEAQYKVDGLLG